MIQGSASEAVLVAILAARWKATAGTINASGDTSRLTAYITAHAHSATEKGLRIAGIGTERIRLVDHDERFRMDPDSFAAAVEADVQGGFLPFFVSTTHGTTSSMAFDPTSLIADVCDRYGIWLHVDAAMSGIAALVPEYRWVNEGLDRAASYATNPHKWMGVNFDCTLFWVTDRSALLGALSILPEYLRSEAAESGRAIDYRDWQVPLGRRFRALKLWFTLRLDGVESIRERIRRDVALTQELASWVVADPRFEVVAPHPLNLVCLRIADRDDADTDALIDRINAAGSSLVTRTVLDGRSVMRVSIGARTTERRHVESLWRDVQAAAVRASTP